MRKTLLLIWIVVAAFPLVASADEIRRFQFVDTTARFPSDNTYYPFLTAYLYGEVDIDVTTGNSAFINALYVTPNGSESFYGPDEAIQGWNSNYYIALPRDIHLFLPVTTLVGYNGSTICTVNTPCAGVPGSVIESDLGFYDDALLTGSLEPIPEPSSILMLATGMASALALSRRRILPGNSY